MDGLPSRYPRQPWCLCLPMFRQMALHFWPQKFAFWLAAARQEKFASGEFIVRRRQAMSSSQRRCSGRPNFRRNRETKRLAN